MLRNARRHLTFANVGVLHRCLAMGGAAYALTLPKNSVGSSS